MSPDQQHRAILRLLSKGPVRGKKKLQKLLYFLQEAEGEPLGFDYKMYYYGPYSPTLDSRVQALSQSGLVEPHASSEGIITFSWGEHATRDTGGTERLLDEKISRVLSRFEGMAPNGIELLGTIHFLAKGHAPMDDAALDTLVSQIRAWKGSKYTRSEIVDGVKRLQEWKYVAG